MSASPIIVYPYPTQIAAGQPLDANPVDSNFDHIASQFNNHGHAISDIAGLSIPSVARVVSGYVLASGAASVLAGVGFTATRVSIGKIVVAFASAFATNPVVQITNGLPDGVRFIFAASVTSTGFVLALTDTGGAAADVSLVMVSARELL